MQDTSLFNYFKNFVENYYGYSLSLKTFKTFAAYCDKGIEVNGVTPIFNPINLYAFASGITSDEADRDLFARKNSAMTQGGIRNHGK